MRSSILNTLRDCPTIGKAGYPLRARKRPQTLLSASNYSHAAFPLKIIQNAIEKPIDKQTSPDF
jgi:hypothetical protein